LDSFLPPNGYPPATKGTTFLAAILIIAQERGISQQAGLSFWLDVRLKFALQAAFCTTFVENLAIFTRF
jgi:hypothetical protein